MFFAEIYEKRPTAPPSVSNWLAVCRHIRDGKLISQMMSGLTLLQLLVHQSAAYLHGNRLTVLHITAVLPLIAGVGGNTEMIFSIV